MKLQGQMVSPSAVGGKDVMSPPPTLELKGQLKLAFIHTRTYSMCLVYDAVNEQIINEQCFTNIMDHMYVHTDTVIIICIPV